MSRNILDPSSLLSTLPSLLPPSKKKLETPHDALAALFHTILFVLGFRLIGVDENSPAREISDGVLPDEWALHAPGTYTFRYRHDQSSLEFIIKVCKLGSRTLVHAIAVESDRIASLDIATNDFVSPSFFPHDLSAPDAAPLVHGFISSNRVADLVSEFKLAIIQKLVPGLRKEGYTESITDISSASGSRPAPAPGPEPEPSRPEPVPPPFAPPQTGPWAEQPRNPLEIGRSDLEPPFPRNPFAPPSLFREDEGNGMYVGPEHPIFGPGMRGRGPTGQGPWGGDGYLPPMGAPPGARFDPVGPGLGPHPGGPLPGRRGPGGVPRGGVGRGGIGRGLPGGGNMNEPDNDEFMPPGGNNDMFL
ncbi:unnamed protein product [Somion occarium]|uniref:Proteasome inhibitor PI31 subunit n=1 Tax=Somion occarium TaxID=3059160 RepID=A0ABP1D381_9APHY